MPTYKVVDGHKNHNGTVYAPGEPMDVSDGVAKRLRLEPVKEEKKEDKTKGKK